MKEMCLSCYGTGQIRCLRCGGTGVGASSSLLDKDCLKCNGTRRGQCLRCRGSGVIGGGAPPEQLHAGQAQQRAACGGVN